MHKLRNERAKEHPECFGSSQHSVKLKTSHTSPTISADYRLAGPKPSDESPDADSPSAWDETQQRVESCGTHSYIEETGCLQNTRSAASFYTKLDRLSLHSGPTRAQLDARIHPPAPSLCLHSAKTQEKAALPLSCARVSQALGVMSELQKQKAGMGLVECSSDFEEAWKAAEVAHNCEKLNPYAVTDSNLQTAPHTNETSFHIASDNKRHPRSSSPAILHLSLHCQTQTHSRAPWDTNGSYQGSVLSATSADLVTDSPSTEERNGVVVIRSTDRAVFSEHTDKTILSKRPRAPSASLSHNGATIQGSKPTGEEPEGVGESLVGWLSSGTSQGQSHAVDDQIIEVDGWCHLPQLASLRASVQTCWGLPEAEVRVWGAQILLALESLHQQGILCRDLNPRNVLLTSSGESVARGRQSTTVTVWSHVVFVTGKVCLTFFGQWSEVQAEISLRAMEQMYCAPGTVDPRGGWLLGVTCHLVAALTTAHCLLTEIGGVSRATEACDWWSLGALLFELLTGMVRKPRAATLASRTKCFSH